MQAVVRLENRFFTKFKGRLILLLLRVMKQN